MSEATPPSTFKPRDAGALARAIARSEVPEDYLRTLPAQSLYFVARHNGLESSIELLLTITTEQARLMLDFDLWHRDELKEEQLFEWLSLADDEDGLRVLQKVLKSIDLKLVAFLIGKYVEVQTPDEPSETPPEPGFYTPDKGNTWIRVNHPDQRDQFYLARLLALIFETSAELFYQLLATPAVSTLSALEEESYQERNKRLAAEGVPEQAFVEQITTPLSVADALTYLSKKVTTISSDIRAVEPLIAYSEEVEPLTSALRNLSETEELLGEMTLIMNAAVVRWQIDFSDSEAVRALGRSVRGAINIGLELMVTKSGQQAEIIIDTLGLQRLFQVGLGKLVGEVKALLKQLPPNPDDPAALLLKEALLKPLPLIPSALLGFDSSNESPTFEPFEHAAHFDLLRKLISAP